MPTATQPADAAPAERIVYTFEKARAQVRATLTTFRGKRYASIREYFEPRDAPGTLLPTKAGISVAVDDLDELRAAIDALTAALAAETQVPKRIRAA